MWHEWMSVGGFDLFFIWLLYLCPFFIKLYTCTDKLAHDKMFQRSWNTWKLSPHITQAKPRWLRSCPVQTSSSCEQEEQQMWRWSLTKLTLLVLESLPFQKRRASEKYHSIFLDTAVPLSLRLSFQQHQCSREFIKKILVISTNQCWLFGQRWVANRVIWCKSQTFWTAKTATPTISLMGRQHTF